MKKPIFINGEKTKYVISSKGKCINTVTGKHIKPRINKNDGRAYLSLCHRGKVYNNLVSRWMAIAFLPIPEGYTLDELEADHIDGDPTNDTIENIQWLTKYENLLKEHYIDGKSTRGENNGNCVITEKIARHIFEDSLKGLPLSEIRSKYGITKNILNNIRTRSTWKHLHGDYDMDSIKKFHAGGTVLTDEIVENIVSDLKAGYDYEYISMTYSVSKNIISDIRNGHSWKHITSKYDMSSIKDYRHNELWPVRDEVIQLLKTTSMSYRQISEKLGIEFTPSIRSTISALNKKYNCRSSTTIERQPVKLVIEINLPD